MKEKPLESIGKAITRVCAITCYKSYFKIKIVFTIIIINSVFIFIILIFKFHLAEISGYFIEIYEIFSTNLLNT